MIRTLDPFWVYVEDMNDGRKKCKFCEHIYVRGTPITRVKGHLSGLPRYGVRSCEMAPEDVRTAAVQAAVRVVIDGPTGKKRKVIANSSNIEADYSRISTSLLQQQNNEVDNGMADFGPGTLEWMPRQIGEIVLPHEGISPGDLLENTTMGLMQHVEVTEPEGMHMHSQSPTSLQPKDPVCQMVDDVLMINDEGNMTREPEQTIVRDISETVHHVEGKTHGDLMVNAAEDNLRTAQVSQDCEATLDIPYLFTEDNFVSNNMECASMGWMQDCSGILKCQVNERHGNQICSPSVYNDFFRNDEGIITREPEQTVVGDGSHESLQYTTGDEAGGDVFPTTKLLGGAFEENKNFICSCLMNNEVSWIGIYGMGGVGKTTLVKHIHNQLLHEPDKYGDAYWITVSQDFSIYKLQNLIAKWIDLDLSNEDDEMHRAAKLSKALAKKQKFVLILDDLWNHFDAEKVGIPSKLNIGCKLILTTRSLNVCRRMCCEDNVIKVEPLLKEEAWNLFKMELGNYDINLEHLAKSVANECDGLPLGIRTMARSMRGVYDVCEWRNTLEELKESRVRQSDMEPEVFRILRYSYLHLNDSALQRCFLYCALFPEDFEIKREELIELFISERMIEGRKSRQAEFDKGHEMLNQLENACLLEGVTENEDFNAVMMHDLVRDMALQEMREKFNVLVEARVEELPDEEEWTENLVRVSLMGSAIKEIPSSHSPRCPNLSTLLLCRNSELEFIGDSFFKQMQRLKVLDLSKTAIQELPDSVSDLVTLTALLLRKCRQLTHVPSLGKLKELKKLDLYDTALREVPPGLGLLSSLKYLDLNETLIQKIPAGILPKLCHLQVLRLLNDPSESKPIKVKVEELACSRKLETLEFHFDDLLAFKRYLKELDHDKKETQIPSMFKFLIGPLENDCDFPFSDRVIYLYGQKINKRCGDVWMLPKGIEILVMEECSDMKSLCDFFSSQHETELKSLDILNCPSIECLVSSSQMSKCMLGMIEALHLHRLEGLRSFYSKEGAAPTPLQAGNGVFSHLKTLQILDCPTLETLFPPGLLPNLRNLEEIEVDNCSNLEKISEEESNGNSSDLAIEFSLPKLQSLRFFNLPALTGFGCGKLVCNSLQCIRISRCEGLKRLPFSCSCRTVIEISVWPKIWWNSVEWEEKNDYRVSILRC